jgi:hypothetical protein
MCAGCALAAASAVSGFRSWLQSRRFRWLSPRRMRALTIAALCAGALVSSVGFSGSGRASAPSAAHAPAAPRQP